MERQINCAGASNGQDDYVEFIVISKYDDNNHVALGWATKNGDNPQDDWNGCTSVDVSHSLEYFINMNSNTYYMWWHDVVTDEYWRFTWISDPSPSKYIKEYLGSAEIYDNDFDTDKTFSASSRWEDYITWIDGAGYVYPGYYFTVDNEEPKEMYVFSKSGIENWRTYSELKIANPDPLSY